MRMRFRQGVTVGAALLTLVLSTSARALDGEPEPDPKTLRFVQRAIAWYPNSSFQLVENTRYETAQGSYRYVAVERECASRILSETPTAVIDEATDSIWLGSVGQLPGEAISDDQEALKRFLANFLPEALLSSMNMRVSVEWDAGPRKPGAVIPLNLLVETGYGTTRRPGGVTADGRYLVMGDEMSLKDDPVAVRRLRLSSSKFVIWDKPAGGDAPVEIVEFSDLECPACKSKWPLIETVLERSGTSLRHGMVSYPLTTIHPWAFRAASATWCVGQQDPELVIPFKETFYGLQRDMAVSEVTPTSIDFVAGNNLDEQSFRGCYLRDPSIRAVHSQMALGNGLGVRATPTYFVNGWMVQVPDESWFPDMIERLINGEEP